MKSPGLYYISEKDKQDGSGSHEPSKKEKFTGIIEDRRSTDCLFFILIVGMWVAMTVVGAQAIKHGNPYRLLNGVNDQGRICGFDNGVRNEHKFYTVLQNGVICINLF